MDGEVIVKSLGILTVKAMANLSFSIGNYFTKLPINLHLPYSLSFMSAAFRVFPLM